MSFGPFPNDPGLENNGPLPASVVNAALAGADLAPVADGVGGYSWNARQHPLNERFAVAYNQTYNPGDIVLYYGRRILITSTVTTGNGSTGLGQPFISSSKYIRLSSLGWFLASDYGVLADGTTDDWAAFQTLLILVRSLTTNSFNGYKVILPSGSIHVTKTIIIPTQTFLVGQGFYSTNIRLADGANCDVVQPETASSNSQAALLTTLSSGLTAGNLRNAFRWGIQDMTIHGDGAGQTPGDFHSCLHVETFPQSSAAGSDPDFDPAGIVSNVQLRGASGDGFYHVGRSAVRLEKCIAWFNQGNGFTTAPDTQLDHCQAGFNGMAGFFLSHSSNQGAGNKSYNNGQICPPWITGQNWSQAARCIYNGVVYTAISALVADAVSPDTDPTNWAVTTTTSVGAWGVGVYFDPNAGEVTFNCDCQENSASNWYVGASTRSGIHITGVSMGPNFNNFGAAWGTAGKIFNTNPNNYADLVLDGATGVIAAIGCTNGSGVSSSIPNQFRLRLVNGATHNDITLAGDTNATLLSPDSTAILASGNQVRYNGVNYTQTLALLNDVAIAGLVDGQVPVYNAGAGKWQNQAAAGATFYAGIFGYNNAGSPVLDGTTTYAALTLAGGNYTLKPGFSFVNLTINAGVTLFTGGLPLQVAGTLTSNGAIDNSGGNAAGSGAGAQAGHTMYGSSAGRTSATGVGSAGFSAATALNAGAGGAGGTGTSGAGGTGGTVGSVNSTWAYQIPQAVLMGAVAFSGATDVIAGGASGGSGAGDGVNSGGGSGAGGGILPIFAKTIVNNGTITAKGGNGGNAAAGNCGGGGGGGGGTIIIFSLSAMTGTGTTSVTGGAFGTGVGTGTNGVAGGNGQVIQTVLS